MSSKMFNLNDDDSVPFPSVQAEGGTIEMIKKDNRRKSMSMSMVVQ